MSTGPDISDCDREFVRAALNEVRHPIDVAVFSSENYFNFGSIIRTCHNFLVRNIYAVDLPAHYERADLGTRKFENIVRLTLAEFLELTKDRSIVAMERRPGMPSIDLVSFTWPANPIVFFGSEKTGVPDVILEKAESIVSIPMYGIHNDHNVAVAAGIAIYDFVSKFYRR
jgi:tRNA G18 (ribose-2'-O)-methylase SpoU